MIIMTLKQEVVSGGVSDNVISRSRSAVHCAAHLALVNTGEHEDFIIVPHNFEIATASVGKFTMIIIRSVLTANARPWLQR